MMGEEPSQPLSLWNWPETNTRAADIYPSHVPCNPHPINGKQPLFILQEAGIVVNNKPRIHSPLVFPEMGFHIPLSLWESFPISFDCGNIGR